MFIYLHILLEVAVYAEFSWEVFDYCREMDTTYTSLSVPYVLLAIKSVFFYLCIRRDPGKFNARCRNSKYQPLQSVRKNNGTVTCENKIKK